MPLIQTLRPYWQAGADTLRRHGRALTIAAACISVLVVTAALTYIQPRHHSTTQLARFLSDDAWIASQFKAKGLLASETVLMQTAQDTSYSASASDAWGSFALKGSVTVMPSSGGAQIIWTLEHDSGYHPVQRWLAASRIAAQGSALQVRMQAFKQAFASPPPASETPAAPLPTIKANAKP